MDAKQRTRLERYFKNSDRFLWGLGRRNQKDMYKWLRAEGYEFNNGSYSHVTTQLLENPGIENIIEKLVVPEVEEQFTHKAIDFLRSCWQAGIRPDMSFLKLYNIGDAYPFLVLNTQFNYVERWGDFAGVWFEEIEELEESK